jgi:hypothetical protein
MARKRSATKSTPPLPPDSNDSLSRELASSEPKGVRSFEPLPEEDAAALAWPVASIVNLRTIFVEEMHTKRTPEGYATQDPMAIHLDTAEIMFGKNESENILIVRIKQTLITKKKDAPTESDPSARIECHFVLIYSVRSFDELTDGQLAAFAQTSGVFNVWPYWRQIVHTAALQLGIPAIVLPTYRASDQSSNSAT